MDHGRVDAGLVHLVQQVLGRVDLDLPVGGRAWRPGAPDVDLRIDNVHRLPPDY
jgi:hypothetical protein